MEDTLESRSRNQRQHSEERNKGQSLVEMALLMPILLLMLLGVLEVGWALRGYLVLSNANREATRFAARGRYLDFNKMTPEEIGYQRVVSHTYSSLANTLPVDLYPDSDNGGIIISHYVVDSGQPCDNMDSCVCSQDPANFNADNAGNIATWDDKFHGPGSNWDNSDHWRYNSRPGELESRLDDAALRTELVNENNVFNCQLYKKDDAAPWSINSVVAVETFYDQPQLLGLFDTQNFLGAAIIPDPIPFYTHTTMRITADSRGGGRRSDGVACELWPIAMHTSTVTGKDTGDPLGNIWNGTGTGNFGWLRWPSTTSAGSEGYLNNALLNPEVSAEDFEDACQAGDRVINAQDCVWGNSGVTNSDEVRDALNAIMVAWPDGIRVPVFDTTQGTGNNLSYHIVGFAIVQLTGFDLPQSSGQQPPGGYISANFVGWDNEACPGNDE